MSERTSYAPGTFSWAELATSDAAGAKSFYSTLFGWEYQDNPIGEGQVYSMAQRDGRNVAALFSSEQPPHWNNYVTVASADESARRARELGGKVVAEPFDVMDVGRMAVIEDPTGAMLCLWEARSNPGAALVNQPGAMTWNDLQTTDVPAAERFYGELFGWTTQEMPESGGYRVIRNGERSNGGMQTLRIGGVPPHWMPYFGCDDVERLGEQVRDGGGRVLAGPIRMPGGTILVAMDPQGAVFAAWSGTYDD
jgi:predicted enzyme related to lactoylglutathione lyase